MGLQYTQLEENMENFKNKLWLYTYQACCNPEGIKTNITIGYLN